MLKRKLFSRLAYLIFFLFAANLLATFFYWYSTFWWFDMPMHFLGGFWVALMSLWLALFTPLGRYLPKGRASLVLYAFLSTVLIGALWELFEVSVDAITLVRSVRLVDSLSDMAFDIAGGLAGALYVIRKNYVL